MKIFLIDILNCSLNRQESCWSVSLYIWKDAKQDHIIEGKGHSSEWNVVCLVKWVVITGLNMVSMGLDSLSHDMGYNPVFLWDGSEASIHHQLWLGSKGGSRHWISWAWIFVGVQEMEAHSISSVIWLSLLKLKTKQVLNSVLCVAKVFLQTTVYNHV